MVVGYFKSSNSTKGRLCDKEPQLACGRQQFMVLQGATKTVDRSSSTLLVDRFLERTKITTIVSLFLATITCSISIVVFSLLRICVIKSRLSVAVKLVLSLISLLGIKILKFHLHTKVYNNYNSKLTLYTKCETSAKPFPLG